jgi:hypothetical protein
MKITKIFIYIITAICLIFEIIGIVAPGVKTLSPVIQYFFYEYSFTVVCTFYLMGHFLVKHKWVLKIGYSMIPLGVLIIASIIVDIVHPISPLWWTGMSFAAGGIFWTQGTKKPGE